MGYYAHINSHNELTGIDMSIMVKDEYDSADVKNIEVSEDVYSKRDQYIYKNGRIVKNPNYDKEQLAKAKQAKYEENDVKASEARYNQEFTVVVQGHECVFDTKQSTQSDLLTAFAVCSTGAVYDGWVTNNGIEIILTLEDVALISTIFKEKSNVYGIWNEYKTAIDNAQTAEEVEAIVIDY